MGASDYRDKTQPVPPIKKLSFPRIVSEPTTKIGAGLVYQYDIQFENAPAFPYQFKLNSAPQGMTISQQGNIKWPTNLSHVGSHRVSIEAHEISNPDNKVEQSFFLLVTEYCDLEKPTLALFLDRNRDGHSEGDKILTVATPFQGPLSAVENYNYQYWAPHIQYGPRGDFYSSTVFFYQGSDGLYLFVLLDRDGGGGLANWIEMNLEIKGNGFADDIVLTDDPKRWWRESPVDRTVSRSAHTYVGNFMNWFRADGAVIGPLNPTQGFQISMQIPEYGQLRHLNFHRHHEAPEGHRYSLSNGDGDSLWPGLIFAMSRKAPCVD